VDWLACSPSSGSGGGSIRVYADPAGLTPGKYTGHILIHCSEAANTPQVVSVVLNLLESRRRERFEFRSKR
jgi:hypothetical protein